MSAQKIFLYNIRIRCLLSSLKSTATATKMFSVYVRPKSTTKVPSSSDVGAASVSFHRGLRLNDLNILGVVISVHSAVSVNNTSVAHLTVPGPHIGRNIIVMISLIGSFICYFTAPPVNRCENGVFQRSHAPDFAALLGCVVNPHSGIEAHGPRTKQKGASSSRRGFQHSETEHADPCCSTS